MIMPLNRMCIKDFFKKQAAFLISNSLSDLINNIMIQSYLNWEIRFTFFTVLFDFFSLHPFDKLKLIVYNYDCEHI